MLNIGQSYPFRFSRVNSTGGAHAQTPSLQDQIFIEYLRSFAQRLEYISSLKLRGQLDPQRYYDETKLLWSQLQQTRQDLGMPLLN